MLAQRQPSFKKCVTAYWSSDSAPKNVRGYKLATEALDTEVTDLGMVEERSLTGRRITVRMSGRKGSENAGISNDKESENLSRRKPKVSWGR